MAEKILIVGLGLIGGSIAKALSTAALEKSEEYEIIGMDIDECVTQQALSCGAIDKIGEPSDIELADIIYICTYPKAAVDFVEKHGENFKNSCIVTDVCGIKETLCHDMWKLQDRYNFFFVGSHPMAGKEESGFSASDSSLFKGSSYIIIDENAQEAAIEKISELALKMQFGAIVRITAKQHDKIIAFTSQLPHVLACAYVMNLQSRNHKGFSAGSYRDVSRVAKINGVLWSRLFMQNKDNLIDELDELIENINKIKNSIQADDEKKLADLLNSAAKIKEEIG